MLGFAIIFLSVLRKFNQWLFALEVYFSKNHAKDMEIDILVHGKSWNLKCQKIVLTL